MNIDEKIFYFIERDIISFEELKYSFSLEKITDLLEKNILKISSKGYFFDYVGVIIFENNYYIILPKYTSKEELKNKSECNKKINIIIKTLIKYNRNNSQETNFENLNDNENLENINFLSIFDYLIFDYIEYGLFENNKDIYEFEGNGEINWEKTIIESQPWITSSKRPFYANFYTNEIEVDNSNYIRNLHKYYLNQASLYFEKINFLNLDYPIINFDQIKEDIGDTSFQIFKIKRELENEFNDRKINLLKTLLYLLENQKNGLEKFELFYGTTSFYMVWEKVCGDVLGNQYDEYKSYIKRPMWLNENHELLTNKFKTLIPDILIFRDNIFYIFDAKYYKPDLITETGLPGIESIGKQYLYEIIFYKIFKNRKNIFLIPENSTEIKYIGKVSLEFMNHIEGLNDIEMFSLPANIFFNMYIKNIKLSQKSFEKFLINK